MKTCKENIEYKVATLRKFSLDFSLMAVSNETLKLSMRNCVWK